MKTFTVLYRDSTLRPLWITLETSWLMRCDVDGDAWTAKAEEIGAHVMYAELLALECEDETKALKSGGAV